MIAIDTSSLRRFLSGKRGIDVDLVASAFHTRTAFLPPLVLTEILSEPSLAADTAATIAEIPLLPLEPDYWRRSGELRARVLSSGRKAKVADCLIAQACVDAHAPLITHDRDFRHFESEGLILLAPST